MFGILQVETVNLLAGGSVHGSPDVVARQGGLAALAGAEDADHGVAAKQRVDAGAKGGAFHGMQH